jgi:hypothetical protein
LRRLSVGFNSTREVLLSLENLPGRRIALGLFEQRGGCALLFIAMMCL